MSYIIKSQNAFLLAGKAFNSVFVRRIQNEGI